MGGALVASAAASLSRGGTRILSGVLHFEHAVVASTDFDESASEQRSVAPHLTQPNWNVRVSGGALADVVAAGTGAGAPLAVADAARGAARGSAATEGAAAGGMSVVGGAAGGAVAGGAAKGGPAAGGAVAGGAARGASTAGGAAADGVRAGGAMATDAGAGGSVMRRRAEQ